jgi:hypothetical protein
MAGSVSTSQERSRTAVPARVFPLRSRCHVSPATCFSSFRRPSVFAGSRCARPARSPFRAFSWSVAAASRAWSPCAHRAGAGAFSACGLTVPLKHFFGRACCQFHSSFWLRPGLILSHCIKVLSFPRYFFCVHDDFLRNFFFLILVFCCFIRVLLAPSFTIAVIPVPNSVLRANSCAIAT